MTYISSKTKKLFFVTGSTSPNKKIRIGMIVVLKAASSLLKGAYLISSVELNNFIVIDIHTNTLLHLKF